MFQNHLRKEKWDIVFLSLSSSSISISLYTVFVIWCAKCLCWISVWKLRWQFPDHTSASRFRAVWWVCICAWTFSQGCFLCHSCQLDYFDCMLLIGHEWSTKWVWEVISLWTKPESILFKKFHSRLLDCLDNWMVQIPDCSPWDWKKCINCHQWTFLVWHWYNS